MKIKLMGMGLALSLFFASCASVPVVRDKDLEADEALGAAQHELEDEAYEAQETLQRVQAERQKEQQKQLERQITDPNF